MAHGIIRFVLRSSTVLMNFIIVILAFCFWKFEFVEVPRKNIIIHEYRYIEFIERVYNGNKQMDSFTLEILGKNEIISTKSYDETSSYFGFSSTTKDILDRNPLPGNNAITTRNLFEQINLVDGVGYSSPLHLYKSNSHVWAGGLCSSEQTINSMNSYIIDKQKWVSDNSENAMLERFCFPSPGPITDFQKCYQSVNKHIDLCIWLGFIFIIPLILNIVFFILSVSNEHTYINFFLPIEDVNTILNIVFLTAFSMEINNGIPSGVSGAMCPDNSTKLYARYQLFLVIFIFLCFNFVIVVVSFFTDVVLLLILDPDNDDKKESISHYWLLKDTRANVSIYEGAYVFD